MKIYFSLFFVLFITITIKAQDSLKTTNELSNQRVRNDSNKTASKWSGYLTGGVGKAFCKSANATGFLGSVFYAYKSHTISLSGGGCSFNVNNLLVNGSEIDFGYIGLLVGETLHYKHLIISICSGLSYSNILYVPPNFYNRSNEYSNTGLTIPVELKLFAMSYHGIGIGLHASKIFVLNSSYAPLLITASIMLGKPVKTKSKTLLYLLN